MNKIKNFRLILATALLLSLLVTLSASASETDSISSLKSNIFLKKEPLYTPGSPDAAPPMSAFVNIWLENVDNLEPAVAYNSNHNEYLVVWTNIRSAGATKDIYARRVRGDGTVLSNFTITHNANFHNYEPDVAYSPLEDEYLIVWTYDSVMTDSDIWARRVKWNGADLNDPAYQEFPIGRTTSKQHNPAVAYNRDANQYLVVYQNTWSVNAKDIDAERVRASDGNPMGWVNIAAGTGLRSVPDVAYNAGSNYYLIAYRFQPTSPSDAGDIFSKVASWNLGYISGETHICADANDQMDVALTASSDEYLAVWEDSPSASTMEIYARRLASDGTPQGPGGGFWISGSPGRHDGAPDVAYGAGFGYLITWQRDMGASGYDVYGRYAAVGQDNAAISEFAIDNDVAAQMDPAVACGTTGDCLMVEQDSNSVGGDYEIRGRFVWDYIMYIPQVVRN